MDVSDWRGLNVLNEFAPLVDTLISSQRGGPVKTPGPKSSVTVNSPLLTAVALFVKGLPCGVPPVAAS